MTREQTNIVRVGLHALNLAAIGSAHWERDTLFVHLAAGRFLSFKGQDARLVWDAITESATDLRPRRPEERLV